MAGERDGEARELTLPYTARAQWTPLLIVCVLGVCVSLPLLALRPRGGETIMTALLICLWLGIAGLLLWLGSYRIILLPDRIRCARLGGNQEMAYAEVREVTLERVDTTGDDSRPASLLRLRGDTEGRALVIGVRPLRECDLAIILDAVEQLAPQARLDASVREMRPRLLTPSDPS